MLSAIYLLSISVTGLSEKMKLVPGVYFPYFMTTTVQLQQLLWEVETFMILSTEKKTKQRVSAGICTCGQRMSLRSLCLEYQQWQTWWWCRGRRWFQTQRWLLWCRPGCHGFLPAGTPTHGRPAARGQICNELKLDLCPLNPMNRPGLQVWEEKSEISKTSNEIYSNSCSELMCIN